MIVPVLAASVVGAYGDEDSRNKRRARLAEVTLWGCQYQHVAPDLIAATDMDMVVVDPVRDDGTGQPWARSFVDKMRARPDGTRRLVLAYLSIGEAENYRAYWKQEWNSSPPAWLAAENPRWPGNFLVRYWDTEWQSIILDDDTSGLAAILAAGYDGVLLDKVDAFDDWKPVTVKRAAKMVRFVERIADRARAARPDFLIVVQNAEPLLLDQEYRQVIDGVVKESMLTGLDGPDRQNAKTTVEWSSTRLQKARTAGIPLFAIEYTFDERLIEFANERFRRFGMRPFYAARALDRLPEVHPIQKTLSPTR
jgi:cysteinyl-tRNA synthetase, unknown class